MISALAGVAEDVEFCVVVVKNDGVFDGNIFFL
jgi:hypothetical protein